MGKMAMGWHSGRWRKASLSSKVVRRAFAAVYASQALSCSFLRHCLVIAILWTCLWRAAWYWTSRFWDKGLVW
jgi:hypothetical protein